MQKTSTKSSQRIPNILIRHNSSQEIRLNSNFDHPEGSYLRKYFPKYYHHLTLEITSHNPLLTKVRRIKKLKRFTGSFDHEKLPHEICFTLLRNQRKEIEEVPKIIQNKSDGRKAESFLERLTQWNLKFFPNPTTLKEQVRPSRRLDEMDDYYFLQESFFVKKSFVRYVRNMRKLKTLEICSREATTEEGLKWLDRMRKTFKRLQSLQISLKQYDRRMVIKEIFNSQAIISHITSLTLPHNLRECDKDLALIPKTCKNLRSLSIGFQSIDRDSHFDKFLTRMQKLSKLLHLNFSLPWDMEYYWNSFNPQASLRSLRLSFDSSHLIKGGWSDAHGKAKVKNLVKHWENIKQMKEIEFSVSCHEAKDMIAARYFMTIILKKTQQLRSLKYSTGYTGRGNRFSLPDEPFFVGGHIYQSLQRFECSMNKDSYFTFDLSKLWAFKNLKQVKLEGNGKAFEHIQDLVDLLEREGEYTTLELSVSSVNSIEWFEDFIGKISEAKGNGRNLKIVLEIDNDLYDEKMNDLEFFEEICDVMKYVGVIPGLLVRFNILARYKSNINSEKVKEVMREYGEIRNFVVIFLLRDLRLEYRRVDGEKDQLIASEREIEIPPEFMYM